MIEHRNQKTRADLLLPVLQGRKSVAVIETAMTALATTAIERNRYSTPAAQLSNSLLKFASVHFKSHTSVRIARCVVLLFDVTALVDFKTRKEQIEN